MDWRRRPKPSPKTWGSGCGPFPGSRPRCPAFRLAGQGCCRQDLDLPLEAEGTEHVLSRLGTCPAGTDVGALRLELEALPAELLEISADKQQRYLLLLCHRAAEEPVMEVLRAHGFSAAAFPGVTGTAAADLKQTDRQLEELQRRREEAEAAIAESARERDTLRTYADRLTAETARGERGGAGCLPTGPLSSSRDGPRRSAWRT